jgi:hypothetical protein
MTNNGTGDRNIFNSTILNNILVPNSNQQQGFPNNAYVIPVLQGSQQQMPQQLIIPSQNVQMNNLPVNQILSGSIKKQAIQQQTPQQMVQTPDMKMKSEMNPASEAFMKEFQTRILGLLFTQNKMLVELKEKNEVL